MISEFKGWHMAVALVSFFGVIIAVNITMAMLARSSFPGLVVENGYVASQSFNRDSQQAARQHAAGWSIKVAVEREGVTVTVLDRAGAAQSGLNVTAKMQRPASSREDQTLSLAPVGAGIYGDATSIGAGLWNADITVTGGPNGPQRFVERVVVK
jgi:nitrogen fixation protein FixH